MIIKVCIVTGSRAEYGLLQPLLKGLVSDSRFELQLLATGMHLSPEFGLTYEQIEQDGYQINEKIEMLLSADTDAAIVKSMGLGMIGYADAFARLKPDWVVILGDRFEAFAAAASAYMLKLPIAHLHGGELSEGASDDALRHAITKMSFLHFTALEIYRDRVIQLGESPDRVFNVGAIGLDNIRNLQFLGKAELEDLLHFSISDKTMLVTYHPVTLEHFTASEQIDQLLEGLKEFDDYKVIFTLPNADADGRIISQKIKEHVAKNPSRMAVYTSLGQLKYLSLLKFVTLVVGNSSSGIAEVPSFGIPTINIGDRQKGRMKPKTVTDVPPIATAIVASIKAATKPDYLAWCKQQVNPFGDGNTAERILQVLKNTGKVISIKKPFHDLN